MASVDPLIEHWLDWIVAASWQVALLVSIVAVLAAALRSASPRLRHALWMLVLLKVFLPPGLTVPVGASPWIVRPILSTPALSDWSATVFDSFDRAPPAAPAANEQPLAAASPRSSSPATKLLVAWAAGCLAMWGAVGWRYWQLARLVRSAASIDEGPLRVALERIVLRLDLRRVPELLATSVAGGPFLLGVWRPCIVLSRGALDALSESQLHAVLAHELVHVKRHDTAIGWLQVLAQGLFWFHPLVWWANSQLRHERECACDQAVLELGQVGPLDYSETILRVLTASRGRSLVAGSLVGVFERGVRLHQRLEMIMSYEPSQRGFGWKSRLAIALLAIALLPMAPGVGPAPRASALAADAAPPERTPYPQVVKTSPQRAATKVAAGPAEISVTFNRDMATGMSWTGGPPEFPPVDKSREARWKDARTCVLPVKLEKGSFYRVGINSSSYQNFQSAEGVAAPSSAICFVTEGATKLVEGRLRVPKLVKLDPANGAADVDPATKALKAMFDMPMGEGWTWASDGSNFPESPEGESTAWSSDRKTCTMSVKLEPGHDYRLYLNDLHNNNFQSKWGVPLEPVVYKFHTRGAAK